MQILGPFTPTVSRSEAVQFTSMIDVASHYAIVAPLRLEADILAFAYPLTSEVWIATIISVPLYILVMCVADYFFCGVVDWETNIGFVLRNTLTEHIDSLPDRRLYQKVLVLFWALPIMIIVFAYAGNLTAMITRPKVLMTPDNAEQMLRQEEIRWAAWDGSLFTKVAKDSPPDSVTRRLIEQALFISKEDEIWPDNCFTASTKESRRVAAICDVTSAMGVLSKDFSETGKCNFYLTSDKFLSSGNVMALQVVQSDFGSLVKFKPASYSHVSERKPLPGGCKPLNKLG